MRGSWCSGVSPPISEGGNLVALIYGVHIIWGEHQFGIKGSQIFDSCRCAGPSLSLGPDWRSGSGVVTRVGPRVVLVKGGFHSSEASSVVADPAGMSLVRLSSSESSAGGMVLVTFLGQGSSQ
jgi:hypothetical protein